MNILNYLHGFRRFLFSYVVEILQGGWNFPPEEVYVIFFRFEIKLHRFKLSTCIFFLNWVISLCNSLILLVIHAEEIYCFLIYFSSVKKQINIGSSTRCSVNFVSFSYMKFANKVIILKNKANSVLMIKIKPLSQLHAYIIIIIISPMTGCFLGASVGLISFIFSLLISMLENRETFILV